MHQGPETIQRALRYTFNDAGLLDQALTHRSYSNEHPSAADNERLEFLGDAVLGLVISSQLFSACEEAQEGELSRRRAQLVSTISLARIARRMEIGSVVRLGRGEQTTGGSEKRSVLANTLEALVGAVYLDGGLEAAKRVIQVAYADDIDQVSSAAAPRDYKSELQEMVQSRGQQPPTYQVVEETGPDHQKNFAVEAQISDALELAARGEGSSKKEAEQVAAREMILLLAGLEHPDDPT